MSKRCKDADHTQLPDANYEPSPKRAKVTNASREREKMKKADTKSNLPFLELPGELRNAIYAYCLTSDDGKVDIHRVMDDDTKYRSKPMRQLFNGGKKKYKDISHQLLRTCKQISQEATPLLYSENVFSFHNIQDLASFFGRHATRVADIRKITISDYIVLNASRGTLSRTETVFSLLAFAENLDSLKLDLYWGQDQDIREAARTFYHVARNWMEAVAIRKGNRTAAVEMISAYGSDSSVMSISTSPYPVPFDQVDAQFRKALKKLLTA